MKANTETMEARINMVSPASDSIEDHDQPVQAGKRDETKGQIGENEHGTPP